MKTKFLFTMCATALLVSCTNEEFISAPENDLTDRATVEVTLGAEMGGYSIVGGAATRTIWENGKYLWEAGDMLGACLVDGSAKGTAAYDKITTNHPYSPIEEITDPVETATFSTNTTVVEGIYVFYHGYKDNVLTDRKIHVDFPVQTYDPKKPYKHLTDNNFFVSPLINIKSVIGYGKANMIPVQFTSIYSGFAPKMKNTSGNEVKISKIEVVSTNPSAFNLGGDIETIAEGKFGAAIDNDAEDLAAKIKTAKEAMQAVGVNLYASSGAVTSNAVSIALPDVTLAADAELQVRMLFPAGHYDANSLNLKVYTDKGVCEVPVASVALDFKRDVFRENSITYELGEFEVLDNFDIADKAGWDYAVKFVGDNMGSYMNKPFTFTLKGNVTLTEASDIPGFPINVKSAAAEKLILEKEAATFSLKAGSYIQSLEVAEGTTLNLDGGSMIKTLANKGAVVVPAGKTVASQTDAASAYSTWTGSKVYGISALTNDGTITIAKDGKLDFAVSTVAPTLNEGGEVVNNGTLVIGLATTNFGKITNTGTLTVDAALTNNATGLITNNGVLTGDSNGGKTITNDGAMFLGQDCTVKDLYTTAGAIITNGSAGVITLESTNDVFKGHDGTATDNSLIDNTTNTGAITSVAITATTELSSLPGEVNCLSISGTWTAEQAANLNKAAITNLIMAGASIEMNGAVKLESYVTKIIVKEGENTVTNESTAAMLATNADLTIEPGAKLTVGENVRFGLKSAAVATITVLGELVNSGAIAGAITVGTSGTEDADKAINAGAKITNNAAAYLTAGSGYSPSDITAAALTNYGTVVNIATGTITATKVDGTGSISGGYTTASGATVAADAVGMAD